ncbi:hypothetical protein [Chryseobacterium tongliaoense]|uniref:hypothetical protein n=1 Tax=Chryseobacterium tongliaoense TaxID=3240933 RepID=UPI003513C0CF
MYQYPFRSEKGYEGKYNVMEFRPFHDRIVRHQLIGVKRIAEVSSFGKHQLSWIIIQSINIP